MKELETSMDAGRLVTLAEKANKAHRHAQSAARRRVKHGLEAGKLLMEAKGTVGHGNFTEWVEKNFEGTPRHARRYMTFATAVEQSRIDPDEVSSLAEVERLLRESDAEPTHGKYEPEVPGEEYDFRNPNWESEEPNAGSESPPQPKKGPSPSKKKDVDPLRDAMKAIGRALRAASDEQRSEWAQLLRDDIDIYMGSLDQEEAA
jgi:Protein of unknown function (DUF3102)